MKALKFRPSSIHNITLLTVEDKIHHIQQGDEPLRCQLIGDYRPFIKKVVSKTCRRYIDHTMDEYSIGLLAFNEAIDQFRTESRSHFLPFSKIVIQRRVVDFIRKEMNQTKRIFLAKAEHGEEDVPEESQTQIDSSLRHFKAERRNEELIYTIEEFKRALSDYDITLNRVMKQCPKHRDARERAKKIAKTIVENEHLSFHLRHYKKLPMNDLLREVSCSRKTIERHRSYIISIALIYLKPFVELKSFI